MELIQLPYNSDINSLLPYMNEEGPIPAPGHDDTTRPAFAIGSDVRVRWLTRGDAGFEQDPFNFDLYFFGLIAAQKMDDHVLWASISAGQWVSDGTLTISGYVYRKWYRDVTMPSSITSPDGSVHIPEIQPGLYSICLAQNGRHHGGRPSTSSLAKSEIMHSGVSDTVCHDCAFELTPSSVVFNDDLVVRTEMNSRTAGERAIFEDEFIPIGQVEAGKGLRVRYRSSTGVLFGYDTDASKGYNIVLEADEGVGVRQVDAVDLAVERGPYIPTLLDFASSLTPLRDVGGLIVGNADYYHASGFSGEVSEHFRIDSFGLRVFVDETATGEVLPYFYIPHNNLYVTHRDGADVVTQPVTDGHRTTNHIQFQDSASVRFTVEDVFLETETIEGASYKQGVRITAELDPPMFEGVSVFVDDATGATKESWLNGDTIVFEDTTHADASIAAFEQPDDPQNVGSTGVLGPHHLPVRFMDPGATADAQIMAYVESNGIQAEEGPIGSDTHSDSLRYNGPGRGIQVLKFDDDPTTATKIVPRWFQDSKGRNVLELGVQSPDAVLWPTFSANWYCETGLGVGESLRVGSVTDSAGALSRNRRVHAFGPYGLTGLGTLNTLYNNYTADFEPQTVVCQPHPGIAPVSFESMIIKRSGWYHVDVSCEGQSSYDFSICGGGEFEGSVAFAVELAMFVKRSPATGTPTGAGQEILFRPMQNLNYGNWHGKSADDFISKRMYTLQHDSMPWSLQGSTDIWLNDGDQLWFTRECAVLYGLETNNGRFWDLNWFYVNIRMTSDVLGAATNNLTHDLANKYAPADTWLDYNF